MHPLLCNTHGILVTLLLCYTLSFHSLIVVANATDSNNDHDLSSSDPTGSSSSDPSPSSLRHLSTNLTSIHFIGDLHGDVNCAKEWVKKTNLIDLSTTPYKWIGEQSDAIVFLGDYVDKGSTSASVLTFIKNLQTSFSNNIVSILGNHDVFQVLDATLDYKDHDINPHPLGHPQHDYVYSFVHPEEYVESGYSPSRDDDVELMKSIYDALSYVYDQRMEGSVKFCSTDVCVKNTLDNDRFVDLFTSVPPFVDDEELATRARQRLFVWREEYMQGLYDSGLLHWMVEQPLVAIVGDALLVHGGVETGIIKYAARIGKEGGVSTEDMLNDLINHKFTSFFKKHLDQNDDNNDNGGDDNGGEGGKANSIKDRLTEGYTFQIIMSIIQHRGYFKEHGCEDVTTVLNELQNENVNRISVGHTPRDYAEEFCGGKLLATDSSLSRSFRAYGNLYCPLDDKYSTEVAPVGGLHQAGSCSMSYFDDKCDGSISVLVRESPEHEWPSNVKHIHMTDDTLKHDDVNEKEEL